MQDDGRGCYFYRPGYLPPKFSDEIVGRKREVLSQDIPAEVLILDRLRQHTLDVSGIYDLLLRL